MIDWQNFTPLSALAGGVLIGAAASLLVVRAGEILGASGVFASLLQRDQAGNGWRWSLIAGLVATPVALKAVYPAAIPQASHPPTLLLIAGGLLVGVGARLGSGCTSGHGVCGLSRLSLRSLAATLCFMASGFSTAYVVLHLVSGR